MADDKQYRYILQTGLDEYFARPIGVRGLTEEFSSVDEEFRFGFTNKINGEITFTNEEGDYDWLFALENSVNKCRSITVKIEKKCGGSFVEWRTSYIRLVEGKWDLDKCIVTFPLNVTNEYSCYSDNRSKEINLFTGPINRVTAKILKGSLEYHDYSSETYEIDKLSEFGGISPALQGWAVYRVEYILGSPNLYNFYYAREVATLDCSDDPGPGWVEIDDNCPTNKTWARKPILADFTPLYVNNQVPADGQAPIRHFGGDLFAYNIIGQVLPSVIDNGILIKDIIEFYISEYCGLPVRSVFLNINPNEEYTTLYPSFPDRSDLYDIIYQKSDVKRPGAKNNATKAITNLQKILNDIFKKYNLRYSIINNVFVIEHISYFPRTQTLDLTTNTYKRRMLYTKQYSYATERIPRFERFTDKEAGSADFIGLPIEYTGDCATDRQGENEKLHNLEEITTDVEYCLINSDPKSQLVSDTGLVMVCCKKEGDEYYMQMVDPVIDTGHHLNNLLSWAYVHEHYHKHERLLKNGYLNGSYTTFITTKPFKKRVRVNIRFCCDDSIDLNGTVNTEMGVARIDSAAFRMYEDELGLDLMYGDETEQSNCLRPKSFSFVEKDGDDFTFNTIFEIEGPHTTEIEILHPDNHRSYFELENDENGNRVSTIDGLPDGQYRFRKRIICDGAYKGPWSSYVNYTVNNEPDCDAISSTITFLRHEDAFVNFVFRFVPEEISEVVQAEVTRPDGAVYIVNHTNKLIYTGGSDITFNVIKIPFPAPPESGEYSFRFRRVCDAANGVYGPWSDPVIVNT